MLRSARGLLAGHGAGQDFVGRTLDIGAYRVRVKRLIAQGGYAYVFLVQDLADGKFYALKRLIVADRERMRAVRQEANLMQRVSDHENIVRLIGTAVIAAKDSGHSNAEVLLLQEYCTGGGLVDVLQARGRALSKWQLLRIFAQLCRAVRRLQQEQPPIIHRDLKLENLLVDEHGTVKLCDFGSATTTVIRPKTAQEIAAAEEVRAAVYRRCHPRLTPHGVPLRSRVGDPGKHHAAVSCPGNDRPVRSPHRLDEGGPVGAGLHSLPAVHWPHAV